MVSATNDRGLGITHRELNWPCPFRNVVIHIEPDTSTDVEFTIPAMQSTNDEAFTILKLM